MYTADRLQKGGWTLVEDDPIRGLRRYRMDIDDKHAVQRTEYYRTEALFNSNAENRSITNGQRWGDGQLVARIPLNILYADLMPALLDGDDKYVNRWLNDADNRNFRTREGKV